LDVWLIKTKHLFLQRGYQLKAQNDENKNENDVDVSTDMLSLLCSAYQAETILSWRV
jgi:hypothetical protein